MFPSPGERKYGAKGGGKDDGPALQKWLDAIAGKSGILDREYLTGRTLGVRSGTTIYGHGGIGAHPSFPLATAPLITPASGVRFFDVGFRGSPDLREVHGGSMVSVANATNVLFNGCTFSWWRTLIALAATDGFKLTDCDLSQWGDSNFLPERNSQEGQAIIAANAALPDGERKPEWSLMLRGQCMDDGGYALLGGNGSYPNDNVDVIGNCFHDGTWTAIDCLQPLGIKWRIVGNRFLRIHECGIYCGASATIDGNVGVDLRRRDCSSQWIEGGGIGTRITRNTLTRSDGPAMFVANPVDMYIGYNTLVDPMEEAAEDSDPTPWSACLMVRSLPAAPEHLANGLVVEHNDMWCSNGKASHCCSMFDFGGGRFRNVVYGPNRMAGVWKGAALNCAHEAMGPGFQVIDH